MKTTPTTVVFITRALLPGALALFGGAWFERMGWGWGNGVMLFSLSGACAGYTAEAGITEHYRRKYQADLHKLTGIGSLTDDERAAIAMLQQRIKDYETTDG